MEYLRLYRGKNLYARIVDTPISVDTIWIDLEIWGD